MNLRQPNFFGIKQRRDFCLGVGLGLLFSVGFVIPVFAGQASLYFSPASGTFFVGSTFDVSIFVNTGGEAINAVEINLKFDPKKLQIASPTGGKSFIEIWVAQPTYSNTKGTISFVGGVPSPGINTSAGLVSTITFRAIAPGETSIVFLETSKVLLNDSKGTNVLTSKGRGVYSLFIPPPEGPEIFSSTHPDQNKWYKNNNPTFSWEKEKGVTDFSYSFDQDPSGFPDNLSEGDHTTVSYSDVSDGLWYFHVKARKNNVWGGVSHYLVRIDRTPPARFRPTIIPSSRTAARRPIVSFMTTDALSGLDHFQLRYIDITSKKNEEEAGFFTEVVSPYELPELRTGKYLIVIRAYDRAGNWREETKKIEIFPSGVSFSVKGVRWRGIIFPWWLFFVILLIILILLSLYLLKKNRDFKEREKKKIDAIEEKLKAYRAEAEREIEQTDNINI